MANSSPTGHPFSVKRRPKIQRAAMNRYLLPHHHVLVGCRIPDHVRRTQTVWRCRNWNSSTDENTVCSYPLDRTDQTGSHLHCCVHPATRPSIHWP